MIANVCIIVVYVIDIVNVIGCVIVLVLVIVVVSGMCVGVEWCWWSFVFRLCWCCDCVRVWFVFGVLCCVRVCVCCCVLLCVGFCCSCLIDDSVVLWCVVVWCVRV